MITSIPIEWKRRSKTISKDQTEPGINLFCGDYRIWVKVPISCQNERDLIKLAEQLNWIKNPRIKLYIFAKVISTPLTINDAINRVFDKGHMYDREYIKSII